MGPKGAAEALILRPGSRFEDRVFEGLRASMPSGLLQTDETGCLGSKGCLCDGFPAKTKDSSILHAAS